jgi:hypothetical protein
VHIRAIAIALAGLAITSSSQDGVSLFRKMQEALGGPDKIAAVRTFEQQVRAESWDGNRGRSLGEVRKRTRWIRPNILRVDQVGPGSTYVLYFDGAGGWEIMPGSDKAVAISGGELAFARKYIRDFKLNTRFRATKSSPSGETVHGIKFARRWTVDRNGARVAEATVERTAVNADLEAGDLGVPPPDMKPVLAAR